MLLDYDDSNNLITQLKNIIKTKFYLKPIIYIIQQ